jgi:hypothetical protein
MSAHLSKEIVERFHAQAMTVGDRGVIYSHILGCETCRRKVATPQVEAVAVQALTGHLLPQDDAEPYHLDLETMQSFVEDSLDVIDRNTAKLHLEDCAECSEEVTDLRESLATMRAASRKQQQAQIAVSAPRRLYIFATPMRIAATVALIAFAALALIAVWRWKSLGPQGTPGTETTAGSQPTPLTSPQIPSLAPSPALVNPNVAENPPNKDGGKTSSSPVMALKDGTHEITIDDAGNIKDLPSLPADSRRAVKGALTGEDLPRPEVLDELATADVAVRSPNEDEERIKIAYPVSTVIQADRPTFRWTATKIAEGYRIEIADESFRRVAQSENLSAASQSWTPPAALKRGQIYTWTIRAVKSGGELSSLTSQGKFKVLSEDGIRELNQLKSRNSHLVLGLFYARQGMTAEAEREFRILMKENPDSPLTKKLLRSVRAWQKR